MIWHGHSLTSVDLLSECTDVKCYSRLLPLLGMIVLYGCYSLRCAQLMFQDHEPPQANPMSLIVLMPHRVGRCHFVHDLLRLPPFLVSFSSKLLRKCSRRLLLWIVLFIHPRQFSANWTFTTVHTRLSAYLQIETCEAPWWSHYGTVCGLSPYGMWACEMWLLKAGSLRCYFGSKWTCLRVASICLSFLSAGLWLFTAILSATQFDMKLEYDVYDFPSPQWYVDLYACRLFRLFRELVGNHMLRHAL